MRGHAHQNQGCCGREEATRAGYDLSQPTCVPHTRPASQVVLGMQEATHPRPSGVQDWPPGQAPPALPHCSVPPQPSSSVPHTLPGAHDTLGTHAGTGVMHLVPSRLQTAPPGQLPPSSGGPQAIMPSQPSSLKPHTRPAGHSVAGVQGGFSGTHWCSDVQKVPAGQTPQLMGFPQALVRVPHSWVSGQPVSKRHGTARGVGGARVGQRPGGLVGCHL
jgi:hypothetical protein